MTEIVTREFVTARETKRIASFCYATVKRGKNMTKDRIRKKLSRFAAYNARKRQTLELFERRGWLNPAAWAVLAGFYPIRASYSYLGRLCKWGLLTRRQDVRGLILYRLSERGRARLAWLRKGFSRS